MTHTACSGTIEIRTDPQNTAYVVTSGARARDTGSDVVVAERSGALLIGDEAERERARQDAFRAFEVGIEDREEAVVAKERVEELWEKSQGWERHDDANAKLRRAFRVGRDERKRLAGRDAGLAEKMSFGFELVGEVEGDVRRARMVEFGGPDLRVGIVDDVTAEERMAGRPLFAASGDTVAIAGKKPRTSDGGSAKKSAAAKSQLPAATLHTNLVAATRARLNTFGAMPDSSTISSASSASRKHKDGRPAIISGLKRKRPVPPTTGQESPNDKTLSRHSGRCQNVSNDAQGAEKATAITLTPLVSRGLPKQELNLEGKEDRVLEPGSSVDQMATPCAQSLAVTSSSTRTLSDDPGAVAESGQSLVDYASDGSDE